MDSRCLTKGLDMSTIDPRDEHVFPKLTPQEIDRLRRFGEVRRYVPGDALFVTGDVAPGMYVLSRDRVSLSPKSGNCRGSRRLSTFTPSAMWKRC
jgi:hypothetical protein